MTSTNGVHRGIHPLNSHDATLLPSLLFFPISSLSSLSLENLFILAGFLHWRHRFD